MKNFKEIFTGTLNEELNPKGKDNFNKLYKLMVSFSKSGNFSKSVLKSNPEFKSDFKEIHTLLQKAYNIYEDVAAEMDKK